MKHNVLVVLFVLICGVFAEAKLTIHIQSPWRDDSSMDDYYLHILGSAGGAYNPSFDEGSTTIMTSEGDGWFSYTWDKDVSDFQSWQSFTVSIYPNTTDNNYNNNNGTAWSEAGSMTISDIFGSDVEVWLYTNTEDMSYTKSYVAPGSKIVWFKSPWGNKALPQMIFGADSILMRFVYDDSTSCGWFYGGVSPAVLEANPLKTAHFIRYYTPYMAVPDSGVVELGDYLQLSDTVFVDGTSGDLTPSLEMGSLGACFDSSRTLHIYHPWRTNSTYKDSAIYISIGNNILNNPTATTADEYTYWYSYDFEASVVNSSEWNSTSATFNIYRRQNEWPQVTFFSDDTKPLASQLFPSGVYETWIFTTTTGNYELSFSPLEPKTIRLLSPWDNMSPMMIVAGDTIRMGPIKANSLDTTQSDTCGWYQGTNYKHTEDWGVQFRQSFGTEFYSQEGLMGEDGGFGTPISLDSMVALYDTVWVYPYPLSSSSPRFKEVYPERLGICPTMQISAMLLDWAGESYADSIDVDFGGIYSGNDYTTVVHNGTEYKTCQGTVLGMVQEYLSDDGLPLRVDSLDYPWETCSAGREINTWFVPEVVYTDPTSGKEYTNATCRDIDLTLDDEGFWLADVTESANGCNDADNPGFYPLDDFEYLDSAKTIKNPKFDWNVQGCMHNYSFAMKISAQFKYIKGQYFEFRGDDDVWVFINNRLVVDIGGCHSPVEGAVDLDTLGLVEGTEYPFHIFFSERNATGSNFKMRTSINLQTQKTYYSEEVKTTDGTIMYNLKQLLVDESLSCDVSSVSKVDTSDAQSVFVLAGGSLPSDGVSLDPGVNYGGITISENMAGFTIDTTAIVRSRSLPSGSYVLICYLASDVSQYQMITFTVPEYPLPDIAFVDVFNPTDSFVELDPTGLTLRGEVFGENPKNDTLIAHVTYPDGTPLAVAVLYMGAVCTDCILTLNLNSTDSISFLDKDGMHVTSLTTDSSGYVYFYVVGETAIEGGSFTVSSESVSNTLEWNNLYFKEPPVPYALSAMMYDANGDGIADSLVVPFSEAFTDVVPDTLSWSFGESGFHNINGVENIWPLVLKDSILSVYESEGFENSVFTGASDEVYTGSFLYHYTYLDEDTGDSVKLDMSSTIDDRVGPVILSATIETVSDNISSLVINLSEGTGDRNVNGALAFEIYRDTTLYNDSLSVTSTSINTQGNVFKVFYSRSSGGNLPAVGDYVKMVSGVITDLSGNYAHVDNPKVRIEGEQRTEVSTPGLVVVGSNVEEWAYDEPIVPIAVPTNMSVKDVVDSLGMPGLLMNFDIGELATSLIMNLSSSADKDSALGEIYVKWESYYYSHLGSFVNSYKGVIRCNDETVFYNASNPDKSNCYDNPGNIFFEWNAQSKDGRVVGTGAYIAKMKLRIYSGSEKAGSSNDTYTLGIKRTK